MNFIEHLKSNMDMCKLHHVIEAGHVLLHSIEHYLSICEWD